MGGLVVVGRKAVLVVRSGFDGWIKEAQLTIKDSSGETRTLDSLLCKSNIRIHCRENIVWFSIGEYEYSIRTC